MTTKQIRHESFECDICHRKQKIEIVQGDDNSYTFSADHIYFASTTLVSIDLSNPNPTKKPDPEKIEMCKDCSESFGRWREKRYSRCGCCD